MSGPESCREAARLQQMLEGTLAPDEQATVAEHLEKCPACQVKYEELSAAMGLVPDAGAKAPGPGETALHVVIGRLENERPVSSSEGPASAAEEVSLSFLSPPEQTGHLGRLGPYEIIEVIGQGGMGVVLKGRDPRLNRFVAVKVLAPQLAANAAARRRFTREARAAAAVSHNHVVTIHSVDEANGFPYLVMEYVAGCSLADRLNRSGPLELRETLRIGLQVASGLAAAHAHGLIHRDIKPANILLEDSVERVKITDFGLARAVDDVEVTRSGQVCGTPEYMSPEQARGQTVDQRSDLFSLGCVLYAMCAGRSPFRADSSWDAVNRVCNDAPRPLREVNADTPPWLADLIGKLLAKNPDDRIQSAAEVAGLLERQLAKLQHPHSGPDSTATAEIQWTDQPAQQPVAKSRRDRWAGVAIAVVAVGVILGMIEATGMTQLAATVIRIFRPEGTLEIAVDDPSVKVTIDGEEIAIQGDGPQEVRLRVGPHQFQATKDGKAVHQELVSIGRGGKQVVKVTLASQQTAPTHVQPEPTAPAETKAAETPPAPPVPSSPVREIAAPVRTFRGHGECPHGLAFTPDGTRLVSASPDRTIRIWDVKTGRQIRVLTGSEEGVVALAVSRDGKRIVSGGGDNAVRYWDADTAQELWKLTGHKASKITAVAISPDGRLAISGSADYSHSNDNSVRLWDLQSGRQIRQFEGDLGAVWSVAFSPDGRTVLSGGEDRLVRLWDVETGKELKQFTRSPTMIHGVDFSPDGRMALSGHGCNLAQAAIRVVVDDPVNCVLCLWDVKTGELIRRFAGHTGSVQTVAYSPDGRFVVSGSGAAWARAVLVPSRDTTVRLWDVKTGRELCRFKDESESLVKVAVSPDGRFIASSGLGVRSIALWEVPEDLFAAGDSKATRVTAPPPANAAAPAAPPQDAVREVRRLESDIPLPAWPVAVSQDGRYAMAGGANDVRLWEIATGKRFRLSQGHENAVNGVAFSPDGRLAISGSADGTVRIWDRESGLEVRRINAHSFCLSGMALSLDGQRLVSSCFDYKDGKDNSIRLWEVANGQKLREFDRLPAAPRCVAFSPDGRQVVAGLLAPSACGLWDAETGAPIRRFGTGNTDALCVAFSPDGQLTVSGHRGAKIRDGLWQDREECAVRLWSVETGREVRRLEGHTAPVLCVAFSPNGRFITSGSGAAHNAQGAVTEAKDKTIRFWDVETGDEAQRVDVDDTVQSLAFTRDGRFLLMGGNKPLVRIWELPERLRAGRTKPTSEIIAQAPVGPAVATPSPRPKGGAPAEPLRKWSDASGQFSVQARLVDAADGKVVLDREDGQRITVEVKKLTAEDQRYVASQRPEHQGKPLKQWVALSRRPEPKARFEALEALKQMATYSEPAKQALEGAARTEVIRCMGALRVLEAIGPHAQAAAPALGKLLRDQAEYVGFRTGAAEVLGKMGAAAKQAVPDLVEALGDKDERIRLAAAKALGQIGAEAKPAVPVLIKLLSGPDLSLRGTAAWALSHKELQTKDATAALAELLKHESPRLRAEAAVTLSKMGPETAKLAIPVLSAAVPDRNACAALAALGPETAKIGVPPLIASFTRDLQSSYGRLDREAIEAVRDAGPEAVKAAVPVIMPLLRHENKEVRNKAFLVLTSLGPAAEPALPQLKEMLNGKDAQIRTSAFGAIWGLGSPAIPIFIELLGHAEASVRHSAAFHLGRFGEHIDNSGRYAMVAYGIRVFSDAELKRLGQEAKAAVPALIERLRDDNSDVFYHTALALRRIDPQGSAKAAVPLLVARLRDGNPGFRRAAIETLEQMRPESSAAIPVLSELLADKDLGFRCDAARVLAKMGPETKGKAVAALTQMLRDPDKRTRIAAAGTLGQIGAEAAEAVPALTELLKETDKELCGSAATTLGRMGPQAAKAAMPLLLKLLDDEDQRISLGVAWTLLKMGPEAAEAGVPIVVGSMSWMGHTGGILPWLEESFRQTGPDMVPALVRILEDREPSVRRLAMQAIPDKRSRAGDSPQPESRQPAIPEPLNQSLNNLKQIGLAVHNFHDVHKHFPPAVIYGPDGKPWHSWRVLILPFLGHKSVYDKYRFDEPWDGPHNKALLDSVPPVYRDPVHPGSKDAFTHYAAITGPGTAFPLEPRKPVSFLRNPAGFSAAMTSFRDIRDGTSNTVLVGSIGPDRKIPWMKPEDVPWSDAFPGLGKPGSFAAPHKLEDRPAAVLLRADGSAVPARDDLDPAELSRLLQIADRSAPAKLDAEKPKLRNVPGLLQEGACTTEQAVPTYHGHGGPVLAVCFSPDGKRLASAGYDETIHVWNAVTGPQVFKGHAGPIRTICFSPDGKRLASGGYDKTVRIWDAEQGGAAFMLPAQSQSILACFSPDGRQLVTGNEDHTVRLWDAEEGKEIRTLRGHTGGLGMVRFSPDGLQVASAAAYWSEQGKGWHGEVKLWNVQSGQEVLTLRGHTSFVSSVAFHPEGKRVATGSGDRTARIWNTETGREVLVLKGHTCFVHSVCFSPDGKRLASAGGDHPQPGEVKVWDAEKGQEVLSLKGHANVVTCVSFSPDGKRLATASWDNTVKIWRLPEYGK